MNPASDTRRLPPLNALKAFEAVARLECARMFALACGLPEKHGFRRAPRVAYERGLKLVGEDGHTLQGEFRDLARRVDASNDFFIRTTDEEHKRAVRDFLQRIHARPAYRRALERGGPYALLGNGD